MNAIALYVLAGLALLLSALKDKRKTRMALRKGWMAFNGILPQLVAIILLVGILIAFLRPEVLSRVLGAESGWYGVLLASVVGSITLIPGFIAFPTAALLLQAGAGITQIAAFVSSLMMVGVVTFPLEVSYFGKRAALMRNLAAYLFALLVALVMGVVVPL